MAKKSIQDVHEDLQIHKATDAAIYDDVREIKNDIHLIKTNHLAHIEVSMATLAKEQKEIKTNQDWILKIFWTVIGTTLSSLMVGVLNLVLKQ